MHKFKVVQIRFSRAGCKAKLLALQIKAVYSYGLREDELEFQRARILSKKLQLLLIY